MRDGSEKAPFPNRVREVIRTEHAYVYWINTPFCFMASAIRGDWVTTRSVAFWSMARVCAPRRSRRGSGTAMAMRLSAPWRMFRGPTPDRRFLIVNRAYRTRRSAALCSNSAPATKRA